MRSVVFMSRVGPDVAPVLRICYCLFANRAVGVAALVVAYKAWMYG